jgi:hypothetical protein
MFSAEKGLSKSKLNSCTTKLFKFPKVLGIFREELKFKSWILVFIL